MTATDYDKDIFEHYAPLIADKSYPLDSQSKAQDVDRLVAAMRECAAKGYCFVAAVALPAINKDGEKKFLSSVVSCGPGAMLPDLAWRIMLRFADAHCPTKQPN